MNNPIRLGRVAAMLVLGIVIWFIPPPDGLTAQAWHLFAIFITTIIAVILNVASIFNLSIAALAIAILTGTLTGGARVQRFQQRLHLADCRRFLAGTRPPSTPAWASASPS